MFTACQPVKIAAEWSSFKISLEIPVTERCRRPKQREALRNTADNCCYRCCFACYCPVTAAVFPAKRARFQRMSKAMMIAVADAAARGTMDLGAGQRAGAHARGHSRMGAVIGAAPRGGTKRKPERHVETVILLASKSRR